MHALWLRRYMYILYTRVFMYTENPLIYASRYNIETIFLFLIIFCRRLIFFFFIFINRRVYYVRIYYYMYLPIWFISMNVAFNDCDKAIWINHAAFLQVSGKLVRECVLVCVYDVCVCSTCYRNVTITNGYITSRMEYRMIRSFYCTAYYCVVIGRKVIDVS